MSHYYVSFTQRIYTYVSMCFRFTRDAGFWICWNKIFICIILSGLVGCSVHIQGLSFLSVSAKPEANSTQCNKILERLVFHWPDAYLTDMEIVVVIHRCCSLHTGSGPGQGRTRRPPVRQSNVSIWSMAGATAGPQKKYTSHLQTLGVTNATNEQLAIRSLLSTDMNRRT